MSSESVKISKTKINKGSLGGTGAAHTNWLSSLNWQVDFYLHSNSKRRSDDEFDWNWLGRHHKNRFLRAASWLFAAAPRILPSHANGEAQSWLNNNSVLLWEARALLEDDLSKLLFDSMLVLKCCGYSKYYYPRIDFEDIVAVISDTLLVSNELPLDYLGLPLRQFTLQVCRPNGTYPLSVVSTKAQINLLNSYRQYFVRRHSIDLTPTQGNVILDCGACIGEISTLFAVLAGARGEVHLFDPVPLHTRFCHLQASLNPAISHVLHINTLAVGDKSREIAGERNDSESIAPGGLAINSFSMTSLDDYVSKNVLRRVDVIKMDIEGAEMAALDGASQVIREFKPRLSISSYHKPDDLWEIPHALKARNANYKLYFGHHSPMQWESVYYACDG